MIRTLITILLVSAPHRTYEKPVAMTEYVFPMFIYDNSEIHNHTYGKFINYVIKNLILIRDDNTLYHRPHHVDSCIRIYEANILTSTQCSLPTDCGKVIVREDRLTWYENKKFCVGTGICTRQGQLGCSNGYKLITVEPAQDMSSTMVCGDSSTCYVDKTSISKYVILVDIFTGLYYIAPTNCVAYLFRNLSDGDIAYPSQFHSSTNPDEYCIYDVKNMCDFIGPFQDEYHAQLQLPIRISLNNIMPARAPLVVQYTRYYDSSNLLQISRYGPMALTRDSPTMPVKCFKTDYISFSITAVFQKQIDHVLNLIKSNLHHLETFLINVFEKILDYVKHYVVRAYDTVIRDMIIVLRYCYNEILIGIDYVENIVLTSLSRSIRFLITIIFTPPYIESIITFLLLLVYGFSILKAFIVTMVVAIVSYYTFYQI